MAITSFPVPPGWRRPCPAPLRILAAAALTLLLSAAPLRAEPPFRFAAVSPQSLGLWEGDTPVLVYNHGMIPRPGVPASRSRSTYIHPLHGLDGEVLTDDFPADHLHHRGLFWAWPHVRVGDEPERDLWLINGIEQRFERWLAQDASGPNAILGVQNGWYVGDRRVMDEQVWIRVHPAVADARAIDLDLHWHPTDAPISLTGAEGKSYGGLTLRYAPGDDTRITIPAGRAPEDLYMTPLAWADLTRAWPGAAPSGAAVFVARTHPGYPPTWLTRHYGALCLGWPGVEPRTFAPGEAIRLPYRVWIHRGRPDAPTIERAYASYVASEPWDATP